MIIPVKCFTCGKLLGDKYLYYLRKVKEMKLTNEGNDERYHYLTVENNEKTEEGIVLDELGLKKMCCRRHMLAHVDIE